MISSSCSLVSKLTKTYEPTLHDHGSDGDCNDGAPRELGQILYHLNIFVSGNPIYCANSNKSFLFGTSEGLGLDLDHTAHIVRIVDTQRIANPRKDLRLGTFYRNWTVPLFISIM